MLSATAPTPRTTSALPTKRGGEVSPLQRCVLVVACTVLALALAVLLGAGRTAVLALGALSGLELLLCAAVLLQAAAAAARRTSRA